MIRTLLILLTVLYVQDHWICWKWDGVKFEYADMKFCKMRQVENK